MFCSEIMDGGFQFFKTSFAHPAEVFLMLIFMTIFELLVAVMLSAQATDKSVNQATRNCRVCNLPVR